MNTKQIYTHSWKLEEHANTIFAYNILFNEYIPNVRASAENGGKKFN